MESHKGWNSLDVTYFHSLASACPPPFLLPEVDTQSLLSVYKEFPDHKLNLSETFKIDKVRDQICRLSKHFLWSWHCPLPILTISFNFLHKVVTPKCVDSLPVLSNDYFLSAYMGVLCPKVTFKLWRQGSQTWEVLKCNMYWSEFAEPCSFHRSITAVCLQKWFIFHINILFNTLMKATNINFSS